MVYDEIEQDIIDDDNEENASPAVLMPDPFAIPDSIDPAELSRIAESTITEGHAEKVIAQIGQRQPDTANDSSGPNVTFEEQPKLSNQHDGVAPNLSSNPANNSQAMQELEQRAENSEVSEQLLQSLTAEKRAELHNKAANKKAFNPQLTR